MKFPVNHIGMIDGRMMMRRNKGLIAGTAVLAAVGGGLLLASATRSGAAQ